MPHMPAPTAYRDRDNLSMDERGLRYADMLEEKILEEGPESVLAFIMEPIGGAATERAGGARQLLSAHPRDLRQIRHPADPRRGHDRRRPHRQVPRRRPLELPARPDRAVEGHRARAMRRSAPWRRPIRIVKPVLDAGGFQHGHTYAGNPLACAAGLAVLGEIDRLGLVENAATMGEVLKGELDGLTQALPLHRRRARQGAAARRSNSYADPVTMERLPPEAQRQPAPARSRL